MTVKHLPSDTTAADVAGVLTSDGVVVVDNLVTTDVMDAIGSEMAPYIEATPFGPEEFTGHHTTRTGSLIARSPSSHQLITHPLAIDTVKGIFGANANFQLHLTQIISIGPEETAQAIHRDQWGFEFFPFPPGYEAQCNTIWALTDFTDENGGTRVVPGSNQFEDKLKIPLEDTVPVEMTKGSVLFYTGSAYHGGGTNRSESIRRGVNITYSRAWLRQEENQYLTCPHDVAKDLPIELLRLMGYNRAFALGYVDDLRDPLVILRPDLALGHWLIKPD